MAGFAKPKARKLDAETLAKLSASAQKQEITRRSPKSHDEANYPVFTPEAAGKYLIYVPNHTIDGELRMDKPVHHTIMPDERTFIKVRSARGIVNEDLGFTGNDPVADEAVNVAFELAKAEVEFFCKKAGLDAEDRENENVKAIRSKAFRNKMVGDAKRSYTFPIVVLETTENEKGNINPIFEDGNLKHNIYWYTISEAMWDKTWKDVFEAVDEDEEGHSYGGGVFQLTFGKKDENGKIPDIRDAYRDMKVVYRAKRVAELNQPLNDEGDTFASYFDKKTEDWTPEKAIEMVIANEFPDPEELQKSVDGLIAMMNDKINVYRGGGAAAAQPKGIGALASGGAPAAQSDGVGILTAGATDEG